MQYLFAIYLQTAGRLTADQQKTPYKEIPKTKS